MGFWHTGYSEFHEPTGLAGFVYKAPAPERFFCQHCTKSFQDLERLRKHRFEFHPLRQPALFLRGRPVGTGHAPILFVPLSALDVHVEEATRCTLNGHPIEVAQLGSSLALMRNEHAEIELFNLGVTAKFSLDFCVASDDHIAGVEDAFVRLAKERKLSIEAISRFNGECRNFKTAMPYCDGLAHYLYGVMAKERSSESGLRHEDYISRFNQAFEKLSGFDLTLARTVRALVAFHFNHFEEAEQLAPEGTLRHVAGSFANLLLGLPWHYEEAFSNSSNCDVENLLTDHDTLKILGLASKGLIELKAGAEHLLLELRKYKLGEYDNLKWTLLTCEALAEREEPHLQADARRLARGLVGKADTAAWAEMMLSRLSTP